MAGVLRNNLIPITLGTVCGIATIYVVFQPELSRQQAEREGRVVDTTALAAEQQDRDTAISRAIIQDIREVARDLDKKGPAWAIREAIWGKKTIQEPDQTRAQPEINGRSGSGLAASEKVN